MIGCKIGSIDGEKFGFKIGNAGIIKIEMNEKTYLSSFVGSYNISRDENFDSSFVGISLSQEGGPALSSSDVSTERFITWFDEGNELIFQFTLMKVLKLSGFIV